MKILKSTKKTLVIILIVFGVVIFAVVLLFWMIWSMNKELAVLRQDALDHDEKSSKLELIEDSIEQTKIDLAKIQTYFVRADVGGPVSFIEEIESLGRQSGLDVEADSISIEQNSADKKDYKEYLKMRLEADGSWVNIHHFLSLLENIPYKITIEQVTLQKNNQDGETKKAVPVWKVVVGIKVLKLK